MTILSKRRNNNIVQTKIIVIETTTKKKEWVRGKDRTDTKMMGSQKI